ncbi:MAG: hypothetical protein ACE5G9_11945 [Nitrospinales bacterium]
MTADRAKTNHSQREKILQTRPWEKTTGPKTPQGRARSSMNALKHGKWSRTMAVIRKQRQTARTLKSEILELQKLRLQALNAVLEIHDLTSKTLGGQND